MLAQLGGRLYTSLVSFAVIMVMLARILDPEGFGIFNYYLNLFTLLAVLIDFGANTIAIREASKNIDRLTGLLKALVQFRALLSVASLAVVLGIALLYEPDLDLCLWISLASLHLLFYSLGGFNTVFHVRMRFGFVALISASGHTLFLAISTLAYFSGSRNPAIYLVAYGAGMAMTNLLNCLLSMRFIPKKTAPSKSELKPLVREALPLGFSSVMIMFYFYMDTFLLRFMEGEAAVGYYNAAYRILVFSIMVPVLFNQVIFPVYSRFFADTRAGNSELRPFFSRAVLYMGITGIPASVALWLFAEPLVVLICGEAYQRSAGCLPVLGLAMALIFLTYPHTSLLIASGRQILFAWITAGGALLNLVLNLLLIPRYSIMGAAWATVLTELFVLASAIFFLQRRLRVMALNPELFKIVIAGLVVGGLCKAMEDWSLFLSLPLLGIVYIGLMFILKLLPFDIRDETGN
jgi:O-antigen/teichoic acid export membrane protein